MGRSPPRITFQELQAFLDSDLKAERRNIIAELLEKRPDLKAQLEAWRKVQSDLHATFDGILREAIPQELLDTLSGEEN